MTVKKCEEKVKWSEDDLFLLLAKRYQNSGVSTSSLLLRQVPNAVGGDFSHRADAVLFEMYPSRGYAISGFEIKLSRGDWLLELKRPHKAEAVAKYCDFWWLVVPDADIVNPEELPGPWGLMVVSKSGALRAKVKPKNIDCVPVDRPFLAGIVRAMTNQNGRKNHLRTLLEKAEAGGFQSGRDHEKEFGKSSYDSKAHKELRDAVNEFGKVSGVKIESWNAGQVGEIVKSILERSSLWDLERVIRNLDSLSKTAAERAMQFKKAEGQLKDFSLQKET